MFRIDVEWQDLDINETSSPVKSWKSPLVELMINGPIYHLSVIFTAKSDNSLAIRHFRFIDLNSALNSIADEATVYMRLMREDAFQVFQKPHFHEIYSVSEGYDENGNERLIYESDAGRFCLAPEEERSGALKNERLLWTKVSPPTAFWQSKIDIDGFL